MIFSETPLAGAYVIEPEPIPDDRGRFARTFCKEEFKRIGHFAEFVQFNHSYTRKKGTVRGMHFQQAPAAEIKLLRCVRGCIYDVIVDIRRHSPTFLLFFGLELSAENMKMIYVPQGFAHGFQTLCDEVDVVYHHSEYYTPGCEGGIRYNDPAIGIKWPLDPENLSEKDRNHALLLPTFEGLAVSAAEK